MITNVDSTDSAGSGAQASRRLAVALDRVGGNTHNAAMAFSHLVGWMQATVEADLTPSTDEMVRAVEKAVESTVD